MLQEIAVQPSVEWIPDFQGWLIARVSGGAAYWMQSGPARQLGPGDGFVIAQKHGGVLRVSQLGPLKLQFFVIQPQQLNGLLTVAECHRLETASREVATHVSFFSAADAISEKFARIAGQFPHHRLAMRCALLQLWAGAVADHLNNPSQMETAGEAGKLRGQFRQLVGQMTEAELAASALPDLAKQLNCSERHFSRIFRDEFKVSFRAHQIDLRLRRAQQLLADSDAKIIHVAYESGYRHLGLFNSTFKKRFGLTPGEWRRQNRSSRKNEAVKNAPAKTFVRIGATMAKAVA
ncbi:MAG TPA: helix-turn-helix transcriptional regulator [Verrucomicrobiae bacterium]|nr:helix-turn-helix transcriptional regulator [Verrucomicrobiae bacterium]